MKDSLYQEALKVLEQTDSGKKKHKDKGVVLSFIKHNNIKSGDVRVPTYIVFYKYIRWAIDFGWKKWGYTEFFRTFKKHFKQVRVGHERYYLLNDVFDLSEQNKFKALRYVRIHTGFGKNEKSKK